MSDLICFNSVLIPLATVLFATLIALIVAVPGISKDFIKFLVIINSICLLFTLCGIAVVGVRAIVVRDEELDTEIPIPTFTLLNTPSVTPTSMLFVTVSNTPTPYTRDDIETAVVASLSAITETAEFLE